MGGKVTKFSDNAICNDTLPVGSGLNGAPSGKRVKIKADECIRFEPPRFTPWSYKVRCIQGLDLAPWPDANIIRNQPGDPKHGEMIASECAPCMKKNILQHPPRAVVWRPQNSVRPLFARELGRGAGHEPVPVQFALPTEQRVLFECSGSGMLQR